MHEDQRKAPILMTVDEVYDIYYTSIDGIYAGDMLKGPYFSVPLEEGQKSSNIQFLFDISADNGFQENSQENFSGYAFKQVINNKDGSVVFRRGRITNNKLDFLIINETDADGNKTKSINPNGLKGTSWYPMDEKFISINPDDTISFKSYDIDKIQDLVLDGEIAQKAKQRFEDDFNKESAFGCDLEHEYDGITTSKHWKPKSQISDDDFLQNSYSRTRKTYGKIKLAIDASVEGRASFFRVEKNIPCGENVAAKIVEDGTSYETEGLHKICTVEYEPTEDSAPPTSLVHNELCLYYDSKNSAGKYFRHTEEQLDGNGQPSGCKAIFTAPLDLKDQFHCGIVRIISKDEEGKRAEKILISEGGYKTYGGLSENFYTVDRNPNKGKQIEQIKLPIDKIKLAFKACRARHQAATR
jgi:hypothetical protein